MKASTAGKTEISAFAQIIFAISSFLLQTNNQLAYGFYKAFIICFVMDTYEVESILNFVLLTAVTGLFIHIKYYFSTLSSNVHHRLQYRDIIYSIAMAMLLYIAISSKTVPLTSRYVILLFSVAAYIGTCVVMMNSVKWRKNFSRSFLIFHQGKFLKHIIHQNKLSEKDIVASLKLKGISNLNEIDSIILEANGELSVHFKRKVSTSTKSFDF